MTPDQARSVTTAQRVAFLNALRDVVARRCPRNCVGAPIVSDYDMIWSDDAERAEAWAKVLNPKPQPTTPNPHATKKTQH